ncbi:hypothetical protein BLNAU_20203 [Blattamonas nauphoetae]|uniref:Serine-threonine/tyrosine-protein kinase catalytic domain-containing protein n=1 Tax=Blattamonas nauphoetae TaxID=2049346 RepID=A0ABQ9X3I2_9EUKA|nr:hypothetical protein BLNAU_20203 [Blattamonas nauphoetae]
MELRGSMTRLSVGEESRKASITSLKTNSLHDQNIGNNRKLWLLDVQNSSLRMTSWCLDVEQAGWSACLISLSDLTIDGSEIISNKECSPFIVTNDLDGHGCQVQIIQCSHKSTSTLVLPLVGTSQNAREIDIGMHLMNDGATDDKLDQSLSISGVGLSMTNARFPLGTGPLFAFRTQCAFDCAMDVDTSLLESSLVNVTSSSRMSLESHRFGSEVSQRVVGSCVDQSTNHDSGTGMMSPNMGGNVMCLNTSFSSCIRDRNTVLEFSLENRTKSLTDRFAIDHTSDLTSVSFTLCTFKSMSINDSNLQSNSGGRAANDIGGGASMIWGGGAAISLLGPSSSLTITTCCFDKCYCDADDFDGGAVFFSCPNDARYPFSVTDTSFTTCSTKSYEGFCCGGGLFVSNASSALIDKCFFYYNSAGYDGAMHLISEEVTLSECSFVDCKASYGRGGAVTFFDDSTVSLSSCVFRNCSSIRQTYAKDVFFNSKHSTAITSDMFMFCDSTSGEQNVFFNKDQQDGSYLIPQVTSAYKAETVSVSVSGGKATVTVKTDQAIKGLLRILIVNGSNIPRLVHVTFGQPQKLSYSGTVVDSGGAKGKIPYAKYIPHSSALSAFPPTTVHTAESPLKDSNSTEITLRGISLDKGSYWMLVKEGENEINVSLAWSDWTVLTGTAPLYPSTAPGKLEWETEYEVTKVMWISEDGLMEEEVPITETVTFTTPSEPPHLTSFVIDRYDQQKKNVYFNMTGTLFDEDETYKIGLNLSKTLKYTVEMTYNSSNGKWEGSAVLFPTKKANLAFGQTYSVSSFKRGSETTDLLRDPLPDIVIMPEPPRLASTSTKSFENGTTLNLTSRLLTVGSTYTMKVVGTSTVTSEPTESHTKTLSFTATSATSNFINQTLYPIPGELLYYHRYVVKEMNNTSDSTSVLADEQDCSFSTGIEPRRLTGFKVSHYDSEYRNVFFEMEGRALGEDETFTVSLKQASQMYRRSVYMTYNSSSRKWEGSSVLHTSSTRDLVYGKSCKVAGFFFGTSSFEGFFDDIPEFEIIPEPARLLSTSAENDDNGTTLTLTSRALTVGSDYSILVVGTPTAPSGSNEEHSTTLTITAESATSNTLVVTLYPVPQLLYGHTYSVETMNRNNDSTPVPVLIEKSACVFSTPTEPERLVEFTKGEYDDEKKTIGFVMTGRVLDEEATYKVVIRASDTVNHTIAMTFNESNREWEGSAVLYPSSDAELVYGREHIWLNCFEMIKLQSPSTGCVVSFTGTDLEMGKKYKVTLTTTLSFIITMESTSHAKSDEMPLGLAGLLQFGTQYEVDTVTILSTADGDLLFDKPLTFSLPDKASITQIYVDTETGADTALCGEEARPCKTMDEAWRIVEAFSFLRPTILILESSSLSSQMKVTESMHVLISNGWDIEPKLIVPSSVSVAEDTGLIVVTSGFLELRNVDVVVHNTSPTFVFMDGNSATMELKDGLFTVEPLPTIAQTNTDDICSWTTGLIRLNSCHVNISKTEFIRLPSGAIEMKGGVLKMRLSSFESNTHPSSPFPSLRRNIHCSEEGKIEIVDLTVGDGANGSSPWISADACSLTIGDVESNAPLFVPTLSPNSTSTFEKKNNTFNVVVLGTTLIPCGLSLEVFEMQKNDMENNAVPIPMDPSSSTSFTDTNITLSIDRSSFSLLSDKHEWRGRLIFGNDQRTSTSFQIQTSLSERRSESVKENMKWWLPLVIVLVCLFVLMVIVAVIMWRRKQKKRLTNNMEEMAIQPIDEEKVVVDEFNEEPANSALAIASSAQYKTDSDTDNTRLDQARGISISHFVEVVVCGDGYEMSTANETDTLYSALHSKDSTRELCKLSVQQQIARGLVSLAQVKPVVDIMTKLSSHWVLFDGQGRICLKTRSGDQKSNQEFQRWMAPEIANVNTSTVTTQAEPAAVFSLGLVLWEIETGLVPFAEVDEQTAQRRLRLGEKPNMEKVSEEMQAIIDSCLTLDASQRPSLKTVSSLLDQLDGSPIESDKHLNKLASKTN